MKDKLVKILKDQFYPISLYSRQIAGTLVLFLIAHYLSVYEYGLFTSYKSIATFCLMFANLGFNEYIVVSAQNIVKNAQLKIAFFVLNAIFLTILIAFGSEFANFETRLLFILVLIRQFFDGTFFALVLPYFQASKKFNIISSVNIFYSVVMVAIAVSAYIFKLSLVKFLILNIALGVINFVQVSFYAKINYALGVKHYKDLFGKIDKSIFSYMSVTICYYLYSQIQGLFVATYTPKEEAALYFAAFTIATIIGLLLTAQVQKMVPEMIKANVDKINNIIKKELIFIMGINTLVFLFFVFFGKWLLLLLYGQEYYLKAYPLLLILTISNISIALAAIYGAYITASGNQHLKIRMQIEAIFIAIISLAILHKLGIYAATISYFLSATHIGIRYVIKTKQLLRLDNIKENVCKSKN